MFSGIVEEVGSVLECKDSAEGRRLRIKASQILNGLSLGDSVSVSGACLTVVEHDQTSFSVEAVHETLRRTKLGKLGTGSPVNLEGAIRFNDRLGGHLVTGHVDATAQVKKIVPEGFSKVISFEMDLDWSPFFVEKGSVSVDGVSLTIAGCDAILPANLSGFTEKPRFNFSVALIPYTLEHTTLGNLTEGDTVNIESDVIARYVARWLAPNLSQHLTVQSAQLSKILASDKLSAASEHTGPVQLLQ
jgi:riboflavin synthase